MASPSPLRAVRFAARAVPSKLGAAARAARVDPVRGPLVALAASVPSRVLHVQWYALVAHGDRPQDPVPGFVVRRCDAADASALERVGEITALEATRRLDDGHVAYLAEIDGVGVGYKWFRVGGWREANIEYEMGGTDAWAYDLFVAPGARGRGVASSLNAWSAADLRDRGVTLIVGAIPYLTAGSMEAARRAGGREVAAVTVVRTGPVEFVSETDPASGSHTYRRFRRSRRPVTLPIHQGDERGAQ